MSNSLIHIGTDDSGIVVEVDVDSWLNDHNAEDLWCAITLRDDEFHCISHEYIDWGSLHFFHMKLAEALARETGRAFFKGDFGNLELAVEFSEGGDVTVKGSLSSYLGHSVCSFRFDNLKKHDLRNTVREVWQILDRNSART